jgi:hypothetical protein
VVVEAKMASGLSAGTTRAPDFNQAARNVACIAQVGARRSGRISPFIGSPEVLKKQDFHNPGTRVRRQLARGRHRDTLAEGLLDQGAW